MAESEAAAKKEQVSTLPKWAQARIQWLEARVQQYEQELKDVRGGRPDARIQVRPGGVEPSFGLAEYGSVRFALGDLKHRDGSPRHWIEFRMRDGKVEIMGSSSLLLFSQSSNVAYADIDDRYELNEDSPIRDLGQRLMQELVAKGLGWQDGLNLITKADPEKTKKLRLFKSDGD